MKLSLLFRTSAIIVATSLFPAAALAVPYDVNSMGTLVGTFSGNTPHGPGTFYKAGSGGSEEGTAINTFATSIGSGGTGATIIWHGPQLNLDFLYLKASNSYVKWDISNFDSSIYDSIVVGNLGLITNKKGVSQAISHVQLEGGVNNVPDGGTTLLPFGLALLALMIVRRRLKAI